MQQLSYQNAVAVASLPPASPTLAGVTVRLLADNKPYWCDGGSWYDLTTTVGARSPLVDKRVSYWAADPSGVGYSSAFGFGNFTFAGKTVQVPISNGGSAAERTLKVSYASISQGQPGGTREATGRCFIAGPNWGGFYYSCKFCIPGASRVFAANSGRFAGLALASLGNAVHNVNSMRYGVVLGHAPNEGTWSIGYGGAQPQTPIRLGAEFPVNGTDVMQLDLWSYPDMSGRVGYKVTRIVDLNTRRVAEGFVPLVAINAQVMADSSLALGHFCGVWTNTSAKGVIDNALISLITVYVETPW